MGCKTLAGKRFGDTTIKDLPNDAMLTLELTPANAAEYLRTQGWCKGQDIAVEPLSWGVSNAVLRVTTPEATFILKQSRPQLRTRETWLSDIGRVFREVRVLQLLAPLLPAGVVPRVLFVDRAHHAFALEHAPRDAEVWKQQLLDGVVDPCVAGQAGLVLGLIHETTSQRLADAAVDGVDLNDRTVFVQLRVDPFYRRVQERRPEVAAVIEPLIVQLLTIREALCHGDFSPKNMLVHRDGNGAFTLVDYETGHFGDPTMDLGFFLSHLLLKAIRAGAQSAPYLALTASFWDGYGRIVRFRPLAELVRRGSLHAGVCLLARVDGTSPVDYLSEESQRETVRRIGRRLLLEPVDGWSEVLKVVESEIVASQ
jgi:5-methylthioribose kinase